MRISFVSRAFVWVTTCRDPRCRSFCAASGTTSLRDQAYAWFTRLRGELDTRTASSLYLSAMRTLPLFAAVVLAIPTMGIDLVLPDQQARALLTVLLAAIAGIYVGFALMDGRPHIVVLEASIALAFVLLATLGAQASLLVLAMGYIGHGVWDLVHHPNYVPTRLVAWYPPFCALYDWLIAAFILVRFVL